jgi:small subunit ribosomal protein S17
MDTAQRGKRKVKKGVVVASKMDKTLVVRVDRTMAHPRYKKVITRSNKFYVHDESNSKQVGDKVTIMETRPLSKLKRWRVTEN